MYVISYVFKTVNIYTTSISEISENVKYNDVKQCLLEI